ncbi:HK97 gp10 family phage protein [bacterium]|nr:HK97 gp10 family phage protein [bacterium]
MEKELARFERDLNEFSKLIDVELRKVLRKISFDLFKKIVMRTPVDTGRARASWKVSKDTANIGFTAKEGREYSLQDALNNFKFLENIYPYSVIYITNNLPYIEKLEFGSSKQAPSGMVRVSLAELELELEREVSKRT